MPSVSLEALAQLETKETPATQAIQVKRVIKETRAPLVHKGLKETRVHKVRSVHLGIKPIPEARVLKEILAIQVLPVPREMWAVTVPKATPAIPAQLVQLGLMARKDQPDALVRRVTPVLTPIPETRVPKVLLVQSVLKVILVPRVRMG